MTFTEYCMVMTISAIWRQQQKICVVSDSKWKVFIYFVAYVLLLSHKNRFDLDSYGAAGTQKALSEMFMASNLCFAVKKYNQLKCGCVLCV
jgi:hypothetical protein